MTSSERADDKRRGSRRRVLKGGKIIFRAGFSVIDCTVRDESEIGARLKLVTTLGVPDVFQLRIMKGEPREVRVVWRSGYELGVEFCLPRPD
jgi:hypothetical protein